MKDNEVRITISRELYDLILERANQEYIGDSFSNRHFYESQYDIGFTDCVTHMCKEV